MSTRVITDNWSLQHVCELFIDGVSRDTASTIRVSGDKHHYDDISEAVIQTETLFDLLTQIVLADEILIDATYSYTWDTVDSPLHDLYRAKLIRPVQFLDSEAKFAGLRNHIVDRLCVTPSLTREHRQNVDSYDETGSSVNPFLASVLWGGAGMVARSSYFRTGYCPHPIRKRLFVEANLLLDGSRAFNRLESVIHDKRLALVRGSTPNDPVYSLQVLLPPIPARVIHESHSVSDFMETAIRLRDEYRLLRDWLRDAETAIDSGDATAIRKIDRVLDGIGRSGISAVIDDSSNTSLSINIGFLSFSIPINIGGVSKLFGAKAVMNKMVLGETGHAALQRYSDLLDVSGTPTDHELQENFGNHRISPKMAE